MSTDHIILGVPAKAHREALLRETAGWGRVPTHWINCDKDFACEPDCPRCDGDGGWDCLILAHPTDPEAGVMGLARLAWVVAGVVAGPRGFSPLIPRFVIGREKSGRWAVVLNGAVPPHSSARSTSWYPEEVRALSEFSHLVPATTGVRVPAEVLPRAAGAIAVHLGVLDRVEIADAR